jgi:hypothetical protein
MNTTPLLAGLFGSDEENKKRIAWSRALEIPGHPLYRIDCDGKMICWNDYGSLSEYGWEIDHAHPLGLGGLDVHGNLRARHWRGNRSAGGILGGLLNSGR